MASNHGTSLRNLSRQPADDRRKHAHDLVEHCKHVREVLHGRDGNFIYVAESRPHFLGEFCLDFGIATYIIGCRRECCRRGF